MMTRYVTQPMSCIQHYVIIINKVYGLIKKQCYSIKLVSQ